MEKNKSELTSDGKSPKQHYTSKTERSYINPITKALSHPVRSVIIEALKEAPRSTVDLETLTGENRYNLYHHLNALEQVGLVGWKMLDNKTKLYNLKELKNPRVSALNISGTEIKIKPGAFKKLVAACEELNGRKIPFPEIPEQVKNVEIYIHFLGDD